MDHNKLDTITNLFEEKEIRSIWNSEKEEYFFSVVDVVSALTDSNNPAHYWRTLKSRMLQEGNETVTNCDTFKLKAKDGKMRNTDMLDTRNILRLIESIPSPKAEPFKMWLASLGNERINEVFDPELAINRAVNYYRNKGYTDEWIKKRYRFDRILSLTVLREQKSCHATISRITRLRCFFNFAQCENIVKFTQALRYSQK